MLGKIIVDREFMPVMQDALERATVKPVLIQYDDPEYDHKIDTKATIMMRLWLAVMRILHG